MAAGYLYVRPRKHHSSLPSLEIFMPDRTVRLHRVLRTKPEKVYRAFLEAGALAK